MTHTILRAVILGCVLLIVGCGPAGTPVVVLATAHPAKFPDAVEKAIGRRPALPARMADLMERPERYDTLEADVSVLTSHILSHRRNV